MKQIQPYLPVILIALAGTAAVYFFWYKPKKDKEAAANAAEQAAYDAQLLVDDPLRQKMSQAATFTKNAVAIAIPKTSIL